MTTTNEKIRNVAEVAAKIMIGEKLHPNQQKLDVHEPEKDELTAKDFEMLRAGKKAKEVKKEEVEQIEELKKSTLGFYVKKASQNLSDRSFDHGEDEHRQYGMGGDDDEEDKRVEKDEKKIATRQQGINRAATKLSKEDVDQAVEFVLEYESKDGKFVHRAKPGVYGGTKDEKHAVDTLKGPKMKELSDIEAEKKKKKKMSEMVATYQEQGLKGLFASLVKEEPDNEQFTKEVEAQKEKNAGEGKKAEVAKPAVQAVQNEETHTKVEVLDFNDVNGVKRSEIDLEERQMTDAEMKKKEEIVKSMKKGIAGFKERYGERAKNVMYATAAKIAKEKA